MSEPRICRICLDNNFQMHQISGSEVQYVFEKLTNTQVQGDGSLYSVCYLCYWQLRKCQQLVIKSQKSEALLKRILVIHNELNLKSVRSVDRLSHGLVNSLKISKIESFQITECYENIKSEDTTESHSFEVMIKDEPEDDWTHTTEELHEPDEKQIFIQDKAKCIETIYGTHKNMFAKVNESSNIANSLMMRKTESLKIPEFNENIKSEEPRQSNYHEVMIKIEPEDEWTHTTEELREPDEKQNIIQDKAKCMENISDTQRNTFEKDKSSKIECYGISEQVLVNDNKNSFTCNDCGRIFDTKALIIQHISEHDCMIMDPEDKCIKKKDVCKVIFKQNDSLKEHIPMHKREKKYKCKYCNYTSKAWHDLNNHIRTHTGEKPFKCEFCSHTFSTNSDLKTHIRTHAGEKPFKCQHCSYSCSSSCHLKVHIIRIHTRERPFKCEYCSYACSTSGDLKKHIRTHTGEKPFKCEYCSQTYAYKSELKNHIRTHTGEEEPFKCEYCSRTCSTNYNLKKHIKTHTGEKPFKCEYCSRTCSTRYNLKKHIRTHTGEKPFKCEYCNYSCTNNPKLKIHVRTHTGEKPFKCEYCNYKCSANSNLKRHIRIHTGEKS